MDCEEDVFESEVCPETAVEDAVHMKLANPLRPGHFYRHSSWEIHERQ